RRPRHRRGRRGEPGADHRAVPPRARRRRGHHRVFGGGGHSHQIVAARARGPRAQAADLAAARPDARHPGAGARRVGPSPLLGDDGTARCGWVGDDAEYRRYHDEEWGHALHGDRELFEKLSLEGFQAGLSWITILRRRPTFRAAFRDFDIDAVASFDDADIERLLADTGIIRNRAKIEATISNARVTQ